MTQQIDVTNGVLRVQRGAPGTDTVIISTVHECLGEVLILESELPWLINALGDIHRQLTADANRAQDAAQWWDADTLASMMAG